MEVLLGWTLLLLTLVLTTIMDVLYFDNNPFRRSALAKIDRDNFLYILILKNFLPLNS